MNSDSLDMQITVAMCAIEALIATHPEPDKLRQVFDQLFGQIQAGLIAKGTKPAELIPAKMLVEKFFSSP